MGRDDGAGKREERGKKDDDGDTVKRRSCDLDGVEEWRLPR